MGSSPSGPVSTSRSSSFSLLGPSLEDGRLPAFSGRCYDSFIPPLRTLSVWLLERGRAGEESLSETLFLGEQGSSVLGDMSSWSEQGDVLLLGIRGAAI